MEFAFKELIVWQRSVDFADKVFTTIEGVKTGRNHYRLMEQLESSVISISNNIAEGKGRYSKKEFIQFLYIARGSLNETVSMLNIFCIRDWIDKNRLEELEFDALQIINMI